MRKVLLIWIFLLTILSIQAQKGHFGIKGGINFNTWNVKSEDVVDLDGKTGFDIGLIYEYSLNEKFAVAPELFFSNIGESSSDPNYDVTFKTNYIELPIMFKYYPANNFSLEIGYFFN